MKKSSKVLFIMGVIFFIFYLLIKQDDTTKTSEPTKSPSTIDNEQEEKYNYYENGQDLHYNYITNAEYMDSYKVPYSIIISIGNEVNDYLQSLDIYNQTLTIKSISKEDQTYYFEISLDGTPSVLYYSHDLFENKSILNLKTN